MFIGSFDFLWRAYCSVYSILSCPISFPVYCSSRILCFDDLYVDAFPDCFVVLGGGGAFLAKFPLVLKPDT